MKKLLITFPMLLILVISGCFSKAVVQTSVLETHDKYLIAKTKEIETLVKLYELDNKEYPIIFDQFGKPTTARLYNNSEDWRKFKDVILSAPSLMGFTTNVGETVTSNQPIEYFSDGDTYTFTVYLNYDNNYNVGGSDFQCSAIEGSWCVLKINSDL